MWSGCEYYHVYARALSLRNRIERSQVWSPSSNDRISTCHSRFGSIGHSSAIARVLWHLNSKLLLSTHGLVGLRTWNPPIPVTFHSGPFHLFSLSSDPLHLRTTKRTDPYLCLPPHAHIPPCSNSDLVQSWRDGINVTDGMNPTRTK